MIVTIAFIMFTKLSKIKWIMVTINNCWKNDYLWNFSSPINNHFTVGNLLNQVITEIIILKKTKEFA